MALQPEQIEAVNFSVSRKGFDKDEVRRFLTSVADDIRTFQTETTTELERVRTEAAAAAVVSADSLAAPLPPQAPSDADRFGALGDRIAVLLREAHGASEETREAAALEAEAMRAEAQQHLEDARTEADRIREEAEAYRVQVDQEAIEIRDQAEIDGNARLDVRRVQIEETEAEIAAEREEAMRELSEARSQVAVLLQEARAQSEFIKREAEEIIREKVRANMDQAQRRIEVLQTTEASSKDRILSAQRELESALTRLESEPLPEFPADTEDQVLGEAEERAIEAGAVPAADRNQPDAELDQSTPDEPQIVDVLEVSEAGASETVDYDSAAEETGATEASAQTFEGFVPSVEAGVETEVPPTAVADEPNFAFPDVADAVEPSDQDQATVADEPALQEEPAFQDDAGVQDGATVQDHAAVGGMFDVEPALGETIAPPVEPGYNPSPIEPSASPIADSLNPLAGAGITVDSPSMDDTTGLENEDALARLVREAMQRAVESARSSDV